MNKAKEENIEKVLNELFVKPTNKYHIRELARLTGLNPNTIITIVNMLEKQDTVVKIEKKHIVEVYLNFENKMVISKKRFFNIKKFNESGIINYLEEQFNNPEAIVLYGSYSNGLDLEKSDIDVVIVSKMKKEVNLEKYEKLFGRNIHLLVFSREKIPKELFNSLINGIVVSGYLSNE